MYFEVNFHLCANIQNIIITEPLKSKMSKVEGVLKNERTFR